MVSPVYDNSSSTTAGGGGAPYSASHTIAASGNNRILIAVFFGMAGSNAATKFTAVQYNGTSSTGQITPDVEHDRYGNYGSVSVYYWLETDLPANGSPTAYNITATSATGQWNGHLGGISLTGAAQEAPAEGRNEAEDGTTSTVSITTTAVDSMIVDTVAIVTSDSTAGVSPTAGQTEVQDFGATSSYRLGIGYEAVTTTTSYSQTWSWVNSSTFDMEFAVAVAPSAADTTVNIETGNVAQGNAGGTTSHTLTTKENRGVIVLIDDESETQASAVTYNSVSMTLVDSSTATTGAGNASSMWFILDADLPVGGASYNVSVTGLDSGASVSVVELNNVAQVIPSGSAVDTTETGATNTSSATITAPSGDSISVGVLGQGAWAASQLASPPTGTGTWTRLFAINTPPSSAEFGCGYQKWTTSGSKTYTESLGVGTNWYRSSQIHAVFAAAGAAADNAPFFGCNF